jgi:hypothetical protein
VPRAANRSLEVTAAPVLPQRGTGMVPPLPPKGKGFSLLPRLVTEEAMDEARERVMLPEETSLPTVDRARVPSPNVHEPVALPILALPVPDRASLDDPTGDASTEAALAATLPQRVTPAPFLRLTVPDPYEFRRPLVLAGQPEAAVPHTSTPQTPKP